MLTFSVDDDADADRKYIKEKGDTSPVARVAMARALSFTCSAGE